MVLSLGASVAAVMFETLAGITGSCTNSCTGFCSALRGCGAGMALWRIAGSRAGGGVIAACRAFGSSPDGPLDAAGSKLGAAGARSTSRAVSPALAPVGPPGDSFTVHSDAAPKCKATEMVRNTRTCAP